MDQLLKRAEVAKLLRLNVQTIDRLVASGELKLTKVLIGGSVRYRLSEVKNLIDVDTKETEE